MILSDLLKQRFHRALPPNAYFWRDKSGSEVDCILEEGQRKIPIEIKSTSTINTALFDGLVKWSKLAGTPLEQNKVIYAGNEDQMRPQGRILSWRQL